MNEKRKPREYLLKEYLLKEKGKVWLPGLTRSCLLGCEHSGSDLINATFSLAFLCNGDGNDDDNFCKSEQDQIVSVVLNK